MLYSQRPALNMQYVRRNGHLTESAFSMYITGLNYITFMFFQRIMIVALENIALELYSIHLHIYFYTHMTSKIDLLKFAFLPLSFSTLRKYSSNLRCSRYCMKQRVGPSALQLDFFNPHIYFHTLDDIKN